MTKKHLCGVCLILLFSSCEKAITIHLKDAQTQLVVEATIENGKPPVVFLSSSLDYFSEITPEILSQSFIHNAKVTVSDSSRSVQLKEFAVTADTSGNLIYYYTVDSINNSNFSGSLNHSYGLRIEVDSQVYTSQTTIPALAKKIDSLWWKPAPDNPDTTKVIVVAKVTDPPGLGNYIR